MEIHRITDQKRQLDDHYSDLVALGADNGYSLIGRRMLRLLDLLRKINGPAIWAVTSHADLSFIAGDNYQLPSLVSVRYGGDRFQVEYLMPPNEAPWPDSRVLAQTNDLDIACEMVAYGLGKATGVPYTVNKETR